MLLRLEMLEGNEQYVRCMLYVASCIPAVECSQNGHPSKQDNVHACKRATMGLWYL